MKTLYTAHASAIGGRDGTAQTDDNQLSLTLSGPGSGKRGTNPEQLFACGYAACFGSAVQHVAKMQKLETGEIEVRSDVTLNQDDNGYFVGVTLNVFLPGLEKSVAEKLIQTAHTVCPYSKATKGNIEVTLKLNDMSLAQAA